MGNRKSDVVAESSMRAPDDLVELITTVASWDDLVLPPTEMGHLKAIAGHVRNRAILKDDWGFGERHKQALGVSVLFRGEPGTGKTMAAEVISRFLDLPLHSVCLACVLSPRGNAGGGNLRAVFDAAEASDAILLFDQADLLFGKRSEVKDSHDRYANIGVSYLLQRMEYHQGLTLFTTSRKSGLDDAFLRRLRFIVNFPFPGPSERRAIWERVLPPNVPHEALDFARLARFDLTGGSILNAAVIAAYDAAGQSKPLSMAMLREAVRSELRKLERPVNEADFDR